MQNKKKQGSERAIYQCVLMFQGFLTVAVSSWVGIMLFIHGRVRTSVAAHLWTIQKTCAIPACNGGGCSSMLTGETDVQSLCLRMRRFIAADLYAFDFKLNHIAQHVLLPPAPDVPDQTHLQPEEQLPPLLVVNIQLPGYPVSTQSRPQTRTIGAG